MIVRHNSSDFLQEVGHKYITFLMHYGLHEEHMCDEMIASLFAQHCKKIIHGQTKCVDIDTIKKILYKTKNMYGPWVIEWHPDNITGDAAHNICIVQYDMVIKPIGAFATKTRLVCDELGFIIEIHEEYHLKP